MQKTIFIILLVVFIMCQACKNTPNTEGVAKTTSDTIVQKRDTPILKNDTIIPFIQVGDMRPEDTELSLKKLYGDSNVVRINRGSVQTVIFPHTDNEIEIVWKKNKLYQKINTIIIHSGQWKTLEGIGIGTNLKTLEQLNGKKITLYPIDDDEFRPIWNNGKINKHLAVSYSKINDKVFQIQILF